PRPKNSDRMMTSSILVAINNPIACAMEDRITRLPPKCRHNRQPCTPDLYTVRPHRWPESFPPKPSTPASDVDQRSHTESAARPSRRRRSRSRANPPCDSTQSNDSIQGLGRSLPDTPARSTALTEFWIELGRQCRDPTGSA